MPADKATSALSHETGRSGRIPPWVWGVILLLSLIQPAVRLWIGYWPPEGWTQTNMLTNDGAVYTACMRMFETGFHSPWAQCSHPLGTHSVRFFPVPFFWMYGVIGQVGRWLCVEPFLMLGWANGAGAFLYLLAVFGFMRAIAPGIAGKAFLLFTLGGGLGGVLFLVTKLVGLHNAPDFEACFLRYALAELMEGSAKPFPVPMMTRVYYTFPLALVYAALPLGMKAMKSEGWKYVVASAGLLFVAVFLNARLGPMVWGIICLYLHEGTPFDLRRKAGWAGLYLLPVGAAMVCASLMLRLNPAMDYGVMTHSMWFSPFLSVAFWHLFMAPRQVVRDTRMLTPLGKTVATSVFVYLAAFALLWAAWHVYYGTYLHCGDWHAALFSSGKAVIPAIIALLAAGVYQARRSRARFLASGPVSADQPIWLSLWFLIFLAAALSAFGESWFLRFTPQRLAGFLGVPLCLLSVQAAERLRARRPRLVRMWWGCIIASGIASLAVTALYFQGPWGYREGEDPFARYHVAYFHPDDAHCLEQLGEGTVLAPGLFGDKLVVRGNRTVYGTGSSSFTMHTPTDAHETVMRFLAPQIPEKERLAIVEDWCVDWVFIPREAGVSNEVIDELRTLAWIEEICHVGETWLFAVRPPEAP